MELTLRTTLMIFILIGFSIVFVNYDVFAQSEVETPREAVYDAGYTLGPMIFFGIIIAVIIFIIYKIVKRK